MCEATAVPFPRKMLVAYAAWKETQPDRGPRAAEFAAAFREEHHHGPSIKQLCEGLGWGGQQRELRNFITQRLIANEWLTNTAPMPWTLRPGRAAQVGASLTASAGAPEVENVHVRRELPAQGNVSARALSGRPAKPRPF